jgi:two-component system LytT family response regulator
MNSLLLQALIVDDERLARRELARLLEEEFFEQIRVVGEASNKHEAVAYINHPPENIPLDVVFLDVNMPHGSGFDVLDEIEYDDTATGLSIVFVTAHDEYAIRAFEVNALDYILKPLDPERLQHTIDRLWKLHRGTKGDPANQRKSPASTESATPPPPVTETATHPLRSEDYVFVTLGKQRRFVSMQEIICITANDNYTELWITDSSATIKRAMMLRSMNEWEQTLPEQLFQRIHRSTIINLLFVDGARPIEYTEAGARVFMWGIEEPLSMSRRYFAKVKERLLSGLRSL